MRIIKFAYFNYFSNFAPTKIENIENTYSQNREFY